MKPTLPATEPIDLSTYEIYDRSGAQDETLVWLLGDEELPAFGLLVEFRESLSAAPQVVCGAKPMASVSAPEEHSDMSPELVVHQSETAEEQSIPPDGLDGGESARIIASSPLTYRASTSFVQTRWVLRVAALVGILLIGSMLPLILEHMQSTRLKPLSALASSSTRNATAEGAKSDPVRVLTVMAGREETIKSISLRYVGHFDQDLFEEIRSLNPDLKDPDHLEDGQLVKIPLRRRIQ